MKFIYGTEKFLIDQKIKEIRKSSTVEPILLSENKTIDEIQVEIQTISFFWW